MKMQHRTIVLAAGLVLVGFCTSPAQAIGYGDTQPRALGLAGTYTAMARGVEAIYWNPANLALKDSPKMSLPLNLGFSWILENNSWSVSDYNDFNGDFIDEDMKDDLLADLDKGGLKFNTDLGLFLPVIGGFTFPLPWGMTSAMAFNLRLGVEGEIPRDMIELLLRGNQFQTERELDGRDPNYDIAEWDGEGWGLGVFSWAFAKPWIPAQLEPYVSQFALGGTIKVMGGAFGEVLRSDGGFVTQVSGSDIDAYAITRNGGGIGFGLDLGVVGVTKDGKTTAGLSFINLLDAMSWSIDPRQDSLFVSADELRVTSFTGLDDFKEVFDNPDTDGDGDKDFHEEQDIGSFSKSLPAVMRLGVSHRPMHRLTVAANYDQGFSDGFGVSSTPRLSLATEYRLVDWFPVRFGLSAGGREGSSSAIGFAFGPFTVKRFQLVLLETAAANRGGFFPGVSQGIGYSINLLRMRIKKI